MRRIKLFRSIPNGDDDPRVREAVLREENAWLREENTRLELKYEKMRQRYSAARAQVRGDGEDMQTQAEQQISERRRGQTPQQRAFDAELRQAREDRAVVTVRDSRGNVVELLEHIGEIRRETEGERFQRQLSQIRGDARRKLGLTIFAVISFLVSMMLYWHPIILTWVLNWEIK